jgi:hypothetical protein
MKGVDKERCRQAGVEEDAFQPEARNIELRLTRLTWRIVRAQCEIDDLPVEVALAQLLDAWAADRYVAAHKLLPVIEKFGALSPPPPGRLPKRLYFVRRGADGPIKIGVSEDVTARLRQLRTGSDEAIVVLAVVEQTDVINERALHVRFAQHRKQGEWFEPHEELLRFIDSLKGSE